jgi:hypothetical protein
MDISTHIQRFTLPASFAAPTVLKHRTLIAEPLVRSHVHEDLAAVNSSGATIRQTRGGSWPDGQLAEDFNFLDLAWHEREFRTRGSFAYAVRDSSARGTGAGEYVGCFYLNPLGARRPLTHELAEGYDVDASWWVTTAAFERGLYDVLYEALREWLKDEFPFERPLYTNMVIPEVRSG